MRSCELISRAEFMVFTKAVFLLDTRSRLGGQLHAPPRGMMAAGFHGGDAVAQLKLVQRDERDADRGWVSTAETPWLN